MAMTLVELCVVIVMVTFIMLLAVAVLPKVIGSGDLARCTANLRQLGVAFHGYCQDHQGIYPSRFWSRLSPEGILDYAGFSTQKVLGDTLFTCPALQRNAATRSVDLLHRNYGINLYASSEKVNEGANVQVRRVTSPRQMYLLTEGRISGPIVSADGEAGKQYLPTTRVSHIVDPDGWNYPHGKQQNLLFMDGSVRQLSQEQAVEESRQTVFWRGF